MAGFGKGYFIMSASELHSYEEIKCYVCGSNDVSPYWGPVCSKECFVEIWKDVLPAEVLEVAVGTIEKRIEINMLKPSAELEHIIENFAPE